MSSPPAFKMRARAPSVTRRAQTCIKACTSMSPHVKAGKVVGPKESYCKYTLGECGSSEKTLWTLVWVLSSDITLTKLALLARLGTVSKEKLWKLGWSSPPPPPPPPPDQNLYNLGLSWGHFYGNKDNSNINKLCADVFLLHLLTKFHFQLNSSFSVKWPSSYWRQYHCYSVSSCAAQKQKTNKLQINTEFQVSPPTGFSHLRQDQSGYHLLIPTPIHWHSHNSLPWLTIWEKDLVNLSKHSLLSLSKHGAEANGNYCVQC